MESGICQWSRVTFLKRYMPVKIVHSDVPLESAYGTETTVALHNKPSGGPSLWHPGVRGHHPIYPFFLPCINPHACMYPNHPIIYMHQYICKSFHPTINSITDRYTSQPAWSSNNGLMPAIHLCCVWWDTVHSWRCVTVCVCVCAGGGVDCKSGLK